jgi:hypothetical protein
VIEVKADKGMIHMTFPTDGMSADEVNNFVAWLRVESIARRSRLTEEAAWKLSEEIKADWWEKNRSRFGQ